MAASTTRSLKKEPVVARWGQEASSPVITRNCPEAFRVNELISGFQIALVNMHIGDHWIVYIPSNMGYGPKTSGPIPGNSTLIFEIKLISIG